ncbi:hypothetical protein ACQ4PT_066256 [Festuca glaucescens]
MDQHPMNIALLLWLLCVGTSGGMLMLLLLSLLDNLRRLPDAATELCAAFWSSKGSGPARMGDRTHMRSLPELAEAVFFPVSIVVPVVVVVYTMCNTLGSDPSGDLDAPFVTEQCPKTFELGDVMEVVVVEPEWVSKMFDCGGGGKAAADATSSSPAPSASLGAR